MSRKAPFALTCAFVAVLVFTPSSYSEDSLKADETPTPISQRTPDLIDTVVPTPLLTSTATPLTIATHKVTPANIVDPSR